MKTLTSLLAFMLLTSSLIAQDATIPQDIPLQLPGKRLDDMRLLNSAPERVRETTRLTDANQPGGNAISVEDRIAPR